MQALLFSIVFGATAALAVAYQAPAANANPPAPAKPAIKTAALKPQGLTVSQVIAMAQAGLSEDLIVARIRKERKPFDLSSEQMIQLKAAKLSDFVVQLMLDPEASATRRPTPDPNTGGTSVTNRAVPAPISVQPAPAPPAVIAPGLVLPAERPSGATNTEGSVGDPDDPMSPHDSGIYLYSKSREGKPRLVMLERVAYQGSKTGGMFASVMTSGFMKAKMKALIVGTRAAIRADSVPEFYFYFDSKAAGLGKSVMGASGSTNPNQFGLVRLEIKKSNRETIVGEIGTLGASMGTHEKSLVPFRSERLKPGLYKVTPTLPLTAGEYCFLANGSLPGTMMAGAQGAMDIFDFGVDQ